MARSLGKPVLLFSILLIAKLIEAKPYYYGNVNNPGAIVFEEPTNIFEVHTLTPDEKEDYFSNLLDDRFDKNDPGTPAIVDSPCLTIT